MEFSSEGPTDPKYLPAVGSLVWFGFVSMLCSEVDDINGERILCDSFFLLSLFVTLYIFLHLTVMHSSTFGKGWVGMSACPLVVLACESLHVCTVCIWRCEHTRFCVEVFYALYINFHSFIYSLNRFLKNIIKIWYLNCILAFLIH